MASERTMTAGLQETLTQARARLDEHWSGRGSYSGRLSTSALSTAVAAMAFALAAKRSRREEASRFGDLAARGWQWLREHQNEDGGWGDTVESPTNISTTTLCWASLGLAEDTAPANARSSAAAEQWLRAACGGLEPEKLAGTIRACYGEDQTFSVPILTTCALGGRLGEDGWRHVPALPFELAACPHQWFRVLRLRVVSYALPALIAIGQVRHFHRPTRNPLARLARNLTRRRTLRILRDIQPSTGGYLEAAPLTSFVAMSLTAMGLVDHPVVIHGLRFLEETVRDEGSWPIDTNLETWLTTLAVHARGPSDRADSEAVGRDGAVADWLLAQHYEEEHVYTHAPPGGWAWTDRSGGVPDADDTAGALIALHDLRDTVVDRREEICEAAGLGVRWLLDMQNRDGGIPTFCRGWGKLPFDRSGADLTAHALRAWAAWSESLSEPDRVRIDGATGAAIRYLCATQRDDGAWVPLWFGNQHESRMENPIYGTSRVLRAVVAFRHEVPHAGEWIEALQRGVGFLLGAQQPDGGFGPVPSIEETALAVEALADWVHAGVAADDAADEVADEATRAAVARGVAWLAAATEGGRRFAAAPIGLYFARLWYSEELYPVIFTVAALERAKRCLRAGDLEDGGEPCRS